MSSTRTFGRRRAAIVVLALFTSVAGTLVKAGDMSDSWITMKTKIALMTANDVSTTDLNVDTVKGVVTLHGKVPVETQRFRAEELAMKVGGVKAVRNLLQTVPTARREVVAREDSAIKDGVEAAFKANHRLTDSGIKVASVNKGVVLLGGRTKSLEAHLESVQVAYAVRGVRRVSTEVEVESSAF